MIKPNEATMQNIFKKILEDTANTFDFNVFGIFPYGSINYGLFMCKSDIDFIVPVIPSIIDIIYFKKYGQTYNTYDEINNFCVHVKFIDFREFCNYKNKLQLMELISIEEGYYYVVDKYKELWENIRQNTSELTANYSIEILRAGKGIMINAWNKTNTINNSEHYLCHHAFRLYTILKHYLATGYLNFNYEDWIISPQERLVDYDQLITIKSQGVPQDKIDEYSKAIYKFQDEIEKTIFLIVTLGLSSNKNNLMMDFCEVVMKDNLNFSEN